MSFFNQIVSVLMTPIRAIMMLFSRIIPGLKKLPTISLPVRVALLVFASLLIFLIVRFVAYRWGDPDNAYFWAFENWWRVILLWLMLVAIPFCVYLALDLLLRREVSPFPDIQTAWKAGIKAMDEAGIKLTTTPIFLVIGTRDDAVATALHQSAKTNLSLDNIPAGNAPLQWYGDDSAMFIHLVRASCVSKLVNSPSASQNVFSPETGPSFTGTIVAGSPVSPPTVAAEEPGTGTGTITGDLPPAQRPVSAEQKSPPVAFRPTQTIGADQSPMTASPVESSERLEVSASDIELQIKRLRYTCSLFKKNRHPICPLNGIVMLVPFSAFESSLDQLQISVQEDLKTIEDACQVRCPVTLLVSEIEREPGFSELMRRMDRELVQNGRIGARYGNADTDIWTPVNLERIQAMASNACKNIEDNILGFFRRDDALTKRGNGQLFILLSKLRGGFSLNFTNMWITALAPLRNLMVGCYFVAISDSEDRQGFVSNVIHEKVIANRGKLSWNQQAIAENNRHLFLSNLFALLGLGAFVSLIWMIGSDLNWWIWFKRDG